MRRVLIALSVLTLAIVACNQTLPAVQSQPEPDSSDQTIPVIDAAPANPSGSQDALVALYERVIPGVVAIRTDRALGSGFMYDAEGHVITNEHVINGATTVEISFSSGFKARGTVVGSDADADIAVIKVDAPASEIRPLPIGDSNTLQVGQSVIAIGNPFGLNGTMTLGIVSGLGRTQFAHSAPSGGGFFSTADIIQTDAAINPGNSGGPLFNMDGEVVGVNQSIFTDTTNAQGEPTNSGVGFSISINLVKRIIPELIATGSYKYPYLGITSSSELGLDQYEALGLSTFTGAYVLAVTPGGPADQAGIRAGDQPTSIQGLNAGGDIITALDGTPVDTFDELLSYLTTNKSPGDSIVLTVLRDGQPLDITVTLGERP